MLSVGKEVISQCLSEQERFQSSRRVRRASLLNQGVGAIKAERRGSRAEDKERSDPVIWETLVILCNTNVYICRQSFKLRYGNKMHLRRRDSFFWGNIEDGPDLAKVQQTK